MQPKGYEELPDSETSERWIVGECFHTHWLGRDHLDNSGVTRLDELGVVLNGFAGTTVNLLKEFGEFAGNVGCVAIQHGRVASAYLTRMIEDNDLGIERIGSLGRVILGITSDVTTTDLLY